MLKEAFLGRAPTYFHVNPIVKAFIFSEMLIWSAYNFFNPILAVYVVTQIPGGQVELAAFGFSIYLIARVIAEIISAKIIAKYSESKRLVVIIIGLLILSSAYYLFSVSKTIYFLYTAFIGMGLGLGISSPAKMSLFSKHIDKNREAEEWSIVDATSLIGMALAGALGGFIANKYGYSILFIIATITNLLSIFPYLLFVKR